MIQFANIGLNYYVFLITFSINIFIENHLE